MYQSLYHENYGFLSMVEMWTTDTGARYGEFRTNYMSQTVLLPLNEVSVTHV